MLAARPRLSRHSFMLSHLGTEQGLSSARIYTIVEHTDGSMWIGTKSGVDRYDGHDVRNYRFSATERYSDASGRIIKLVKGTRGTLYAYDNKGTILLYNKVLDRFQPYLNLASLLGQGIILNEVYIDGSGTQWLALNRGVLRVDAGGGKRWFLRNHFVTHVSGFGHRMLIATYGGVWVMEPSSLRCRMAIKGLLVQSSYYDASTSRIWLGTYHQGVRIYDTRLWQEVARPGLARVPHTPVRAITPLDRHTMLIGIDGAGVYACHSNGSEAWLLFDADDQTGSALHGNGVYDICVDRGGNVWVGSYSGGVDFAVPVNNNMEIIQHEFLNSQSLLNNSVNDVLQTSDGTLWYATDRGVSICNGKDRRWRHTLSDKVALSLCVDRKGRVLVGTYGDGVFAVSSEGTATQAYSVANGVLRNNDVYSLYTDNDGDLWMGCLDGALVHVGATTTHYYPIHQVQTITGTPDGRVAVGTSDGFYIVDKIHRKYIHCFRPSDYPGHDLNAFVEALLFTSRDQVWVGTDGGGIYRYNLRTRRVSQITTADGLPSNTVYVLEQDSRGRILASTDHGLALVIPGPKPQVININFVRGLEREYKRMSVAPMLDGRFAFGSSSGAVIIDPRHIDRLDYHATLRIRNVTLNGLNDDEADTWREKLYAMLTQGQLDLPHDRSTFVLHFENINYKYQHDIRFQYRLEGFDRDWSGVQSDQSAAYTNLPPGTYRFVLRSISRNDGRLIGQRELSIHVAQPWWNSLWAWMLYLLLAAVMVYFVWQYFRNRLQRQYFDEKINFFVNTAHDIRTPLSLILAPLDDIAKDPLLSDSSRRYLDIAHSNGRKLLNMVGQLLDFQRSDRDDTVLMLQEFALRDFLETQVEKFRLLAARKGIELRLCDCPAHQSVWLDAALGDKIFDNILSNAVKYTPEGGRVTVDAWTDERHVHIRVTDTGIGIPRKARKHIFRNFYRADNAVNSQETGSGLGLMLTRRLIERHRGRLTFESTEGEGTSFVITLRRKRPQGVAAAAAETAFRPTSDPSLPIPPDHTDIGADTADDKDTLLFVDDNDELRYYIRSSFSDRYNVVDVAGADEALEYLRDGLCDIVVSDVMMPGMQGDELCRRIKDDARLAWLPVILLTAKSGRDFMIEGLAQGADDYITKPFDPVILRGKIDSLLQNRRRLSSYYLGQSVQIVKGEATPLSTPPSAETSTPDLSAEANAEDRAFVERATRVVLDHLSDSDFDIDYLCREMAMSRTLFYGRLKSLTAHAPQDFIRLIRMERAAALIRQGKPVTEVALMVGFVNAKHFSTVFKKHFGVPPSKY
ncbi:MAG: response regulator [Prevotella sp.]|nr:response regulator [Prevotella sp.]